MLIEDVISLPRVDYFKNGNDFWELQSLPMGGLPVIVGYRGNLYEVAVSTVSLKLEQHHGITISTYPYYRFPQYPLHIRDIVHDKIIGVWYLGSHFMEYPGSFYDMIPEIEKCIREANLQPTDFYK